jgi:hypothetical protein
MRGGVAEKASELKNRAADCLAVDVLSALDSFDELIVADQCSWTMYEITQ